MSKAMDLIIEREEQLYAKFRLHEEWVTNPKKVERPVLDGLTFDGMHLRGRNLEYLWAPGATFVNCVLSSSNFEGASLKGAVFRNCDLADVRFGGAVLTDALFSDCRLLRADLRGSVLNDTRFLSDRERALDGTVIDPAVTERMRAMGKATGRKGLIAYRTSQSMFVGLNRYVPGRTYTAPVMSWCPSTSCHPGLYAYTSLGELKAAQPNERYVKVYYRAGEFLATPKFKVVRGPRFRVLEEVT